MVRLGHSSVTLFTFTFRNLLAIHDTSFSTMSTVDEIYLQQVLLKTSQKRKSVIIRQIIWRV